MSRPRVDLRACLNASLHTIAPDLRGAVVYLDKGACEALGLTVGARAFLDLGASNVCDLGKVSPQDAMMGMLGGEGHPPLVFFITQLLPDAKGAIVEAMKAHPQAHLVTVFCSYSVDAHPNPAGVIGTNAYMEFEKAVGQQPHKFPRGGNVSLSLDAPVQDGATVRVRYFPFPYSMITAWSFVLPSPGESKSKWASGDLGKGMGVEPVAAPAEGPSDMPKMSVPHSEASLLAHAILGVACNLGVNVETFTLGPSAAQLGQEIAKFGVPPSLDGSTPEVSATLILVDRSMDMIAPVLHGDNLVERMLNASTHTRQGTNPTTSSSMDSTPCTSKYVSINQKANLAGSAMLPKANQCSGAALSDISWLRPYDDNWMRHFKELVGRRVKNGVVLVRKWLKEAMRQESVSQATHPKMGSPQTDELHSCIDALMEESGVAFRQRIAIELGQIVGKALDAERSMLQEVLSRNEQQILMSPTPEELVQVVLDLLANTRKAQAVLSLTDVLGLLVFIYSLRGDEEGEAFTPAEEQFMTNAIIEAVIEDDNLDQHWWLGDFRHRIKQMQRPLRRHESSYGTTALKLEFQDFLSARFEKLKLISTARKGLRELRRLTGLNADYVPLTRQITSLVYQDSNLEDLSRATSLLGGLLKMGLGRLGFQNKAKPGDHPVVIVFVVGGISMREIREVFAEIEGQSPWKPQVVLGGTCLLSEKDITRRVWS